MSDNSVMLQIMSTVNEFGNWHFRDIYIPSLLWALLTYSIYHLMLR
jgi:hypothetical protein